MNGVNLRIVDMLLKEFGGRVVGVVFFGSRARGDFREDSDYDILVVLDDYRRGDDERAYTCLRPFRFSVGKDTTVLVVSYRRLVENIGFSTILNALYEGKILYDRDGKIMKIREKLLRKLRELGMTRVKTDWGYSWTTPRNTSIPFTLKVDEDPAREYEFRLKLARDHLEIAVKSLDSGIYPVAVHYAQLSIENSAKAIIALFKPPTWSHRPGSELHKLVDEREELKKYKVFLKKLSKVVDEVSRHHGLATYGDIETLRTPQEIYSKEDAEKLVQLARKIFQKTKQIVDEITSATS